MELTLDNFTTDELVTILTERTKELKGLMLGHPLDTGIKINRVKIVLEEIDIRFQKHKDRATIK